MTVTLPSNIEVSSDTQMKVNGKTVTPIINKNAKQFVVNGLGVSD